jgi:hypothetical protein
VTKEGERIYSDGVRIAEEIGDARNATIFQSKLGNYYTIMGDKLKAIKYSEKGFEEAEINEDLELVVTIGSELIISTGQYGDAVKIVSIASKLMRVIEKTIRSAAKTICQIKMDSPIIQITQPGLYYAVAIYCGLKIHAATLVSRFCWIFGFG